LKAHDKKELKALGSLIEKLEGSGTGLNVLIGSSDMKTVVECVEAVANLCNYKVRSFSFNRIFFSSALIKDPLTQHEISMIDYMFKPHIGYQAITLLTDYGSFLKYLLSNSQEQIDEKMFSFWDKLKTFEGILFFVTTPIKKHLIPAEFDHYIEIKQPPEELQIRQWEKHLKTARCAEVEIIKLVERNPMHLHEIDFIARQATVISYSKGREGTLSLEDVQEAIGRFKSRKEVVLFGR
jgi:hypothetical protein